MSWITIDDGGLLAAERIIAVVMVDAAPIRRMLRMLPPEKVVTVTGGRKRKTAVLFDSGHLVVTSLTLDEVQQLIKETASAAGGE